MNFEIRKVDRSDLIKILELQGEKKTVIDRPILDKFDEILSQTNHTVLLALCNKKAIATLSITIINGIGPEYPKIILSGAKIKEGYEKSGVDRILLESARYIADGFDAQNLNRITSADRDGKIAL